MQLLLQKLIKTNLTYSLYYSSKKESIQKQYKKNYLAIVNVMIYLLKKTLLKLYNQLNAQKAFNFL